MTPEEMCERTMQFALRSIRVAESLPKTVAAKNASLQLVRCSCSVAANYRSAQRARSRADFSNKIGIVIEEADETGFWLELAVRGKFVSEKRVAALRSEAGELVAIFTAMRKTARQ
jgi:four helix bundle protein